MKKKSEVLITVTSFHTGLLQAANSFRMESIGALKFFSCFFSSLPILTNFQDAGNWHALFILLQTSYLGREILLPAFLLLISIPFAALSPCAARGCSCQGQLVCYSMTLWRGELTGVAGLLARALLISRETGSYTSERRGMRQRQELPWD